ncbi:MAG: hypothetical protein Q9209_000480 [Squamulea sp. 1 TL-2023]
MEFEVSYHLDDEEQFWDELDDILSTQCQSHGPIDDALRSYFAFVSNYKGDYIRTEYDIARCSLKLLQSALYSAHKDYVRRQITYSLLEEDSPDTLHLIVALLLFDGRDNEATFEMMNDEGIFLRLVELIHERKDDDAGLHKMLLELLYEMSRIQRLKIQDLSADLRYATRSPLILNEQYMVSAHDPGPDQTPITNLTNKVIKVLSTHGSAFKTFGENLILLLNRESETLLQLLILKLLYLLFTTPSTYEYFYTNDLRVLVDVMIRNLLDLPLSAIPLRHTYLRVLYPLLAHTQLKNPPHYKKDELQRLLTMMTASGGMMEQHFGAVDETTKRLVGRCVRVPWLKEDNPQPEEEEEETKLATRKLLGVEIPGGMTSSLSVAEVTTQTEKPGILTGSRQKEDKEKQHSLRETRSQTSHDDGVSGKQLGAPEVGVMTAVHETSPFEVEGEA